jgi:hypothetical protein
MKPQNLLRITLELALIPLGTYIGAAVLLGHIPANADWRAPGAPESGTVTIFVQTNGLHTGIVVPTVANGIDWRNRIRSSDLPHPGGMGRWLAFGWGDRAFYIDTPTWRQVRLLTIVRALIGTGPTVLHVDHLDSFTADASWRPLKLRRASHVATRHAMCSTPVGATTAPCARAMYGPATPCALPACVWGSGRRLPVT